MKARITFLEAFVHEAIIDIELSSEFLEILGHRAANGDLLDLIIEDMLEEYRDGDIKPHWFRLLEEQHPDWRANRGAGKIEHDLRRCLVIK